MESQNRQPKTRKVSEVTGTIPYGFYIESQGGGKVGVNCDPSEDDIKQAVANNELEVRGFQSHKDELEKEWANASPSFEEVCRRVRAYHARRIAYFVVNGWSGDPIVLTPDGRMIDGLHRWRAANHLGLAEVEVRTKG